MERNRFQRIPRIHVTLKRGLVDNVDHIRKHGDVDNPRKSRKQRLRAGG